MPFLHFSKSCLNWESLSVLHNIIRNDCSTVMTSQFTTIIIIIKPTPVLGRKVLVSKFKTRIAKSERFIIHWEFELKIGRLLNHPISKTTKRTAGWLAIKDHRVAGGLGGRTAGCALNSRRRLRRGRSVGERALGALCLRASAGLGAAGAGPGTTGNVYTSFWITRSAFSTPFFSSNNLKMKIFHIALEICRLYMLHYLSYCFENMEHWKTSATSVNY